MRTRLLILVAIFAISPVFASGEKTSKCKSEKKAKCEQRRKEENARCAAKYSERAKKQLDSKLSKCYEKASPKVCAAAAEEIELQKKLGAIYQKMSECYKNGDKEAITKLNDERWELNCSMDLARKRTKIARHLATIEKKIKKLPESQKLKELNCKLSELSEKYLDAAKVIIAQKRKIKQLEKEMRKINNESYKAAKEEWKKRSSCRQKKRKQCKSLKSCK